MKVSVDLSFDGRCEEALAFYAKLLGGKILMKMTWGESPMAQHVPPEFAKKIIHATLAVGEQTIGGADSPPGRYQKPQGTWVTLDLDTPEEAERLYAALKDGGTEFMPLAETFWARRFGMLVDRFGTPWMLNCGKPQP